MKVKIVNGGYIIDQYMMDLEHNEIFGVLSQMYKHVTFDMEDENTVIVKILN